MAQESECSKECTGSADEICGGFWFISVYSVQASSRLGWMFTGVLVIGGGLYVAAGTFLGQRRGKASLRGVKAHPHYKYWVQLAGLCVDGVRYIQGASARHSSSSQRGGGDDSSHASSSGRPKKGKDRRKDRKKDKNGKGHGGSHKKPAKGEARDHVPLLEGQGQQQAEEAPAPSPAAAAREWQPTRSAHLATGARETGVKVHS